MRSAFFRLRFCLDVDATPLFPALFWGRAILMSLEAICRTDIDWFCIKRKEVSLLVQEIEWERDEEKRGREERKRKGKRIEDKQATKTSNKNVPYELLRREEWPATTDTTKLEYLKALRLVLKTTMFHPRVKNDRVGELFLKERQSWRGPPRVRNAGVSLAR